MGRIAYTNTFGKPPWFEFVAEEYAACRERVGISDYSSFTKIDLWVLITDTLLIRFIEILLLYHEKYWTD